MAAAAEGVPLKAVGRLMKLGGRGKTKVKWQGRDCVANTNGLSWKSGKPAGGHTLIPLCEIESVHGLTDRDRDHAQGQLPAKVFVIQCSPEHKAGKRYLFACGTEDERNEWWVTLATLIDATANATGPQRKPISFGGAIVAGRLGHHGTCCTCSFPGDAYDQWIQLTTSAENGTLSTACVFLTTEEEGLGRHTTNPETDRCWCFDLYGTEQPWGCHWFTEWCHLVHEAQGKGQMPVVFYQRGHLARVGAENTSFPAIEHVEGELTWAEIRNHTFAQLKHMPGLGASQKGEVAYLKKHGIAFMRIDVSNGAPDAAATVGMLADRWRALDLDSEIGLHEGYAVAEKLRVLRADAENVELRRALLAGWAALAGPDSYQALAAEGNLASTLKDIKRYDEALPMYERVIAQQTVLYGATHEVVLGTTGMLATLLSEMNQNKKAIALYERVIAMLPPDRIEPILTFKGNLAIVLKHEDRLADATHLFTQVVEGQTVANGASHPVTLQAVANLGICREAMGELDEARIHLDRVVTGFTDAFGPDHVATRTYTGTLHRIEAKLKLTGPERQLHIEKRCLEAKVTDKPGYTCDSCGATMSEGTLRLTCTLCRYDLCEACAKQR